MEAAQRADYLVRRTLYFLQDFLAARACFQVCSDGVLSGERELTSIKGGQIIVCGTRRTFHCVALCHRKTIPFGCQGKAYTL
jgi:hypothetical protein